jgi:hypothetical protein
MTGFLMVNGENETTFELVSNIIYITSVTLQILLFCATGNDIIYSVNDSIIFHNYVKCSSLVNVGRIDKAK